MWTLIPSEWVKYVHFTGEVGRPVGYIRADITVEEARQIIDDLSALVVK